MVEQRYQAVMSALADGLSISRVAEKTGMSRRTLDVSADHLVVPCDTMSSVASEPEGMAPTGKPGAAAFRQEAYTMALYVAVCLLAALLALSDTTIAANHLIALIWGTTIGLAVAHFFAFRLSARLVGEGTIRAHDVESGTAQLIGAAAVAALVSIAVIVLPTRLEYQAAEFGLAAFIACIGFVVSRRGGAKPVRSAVYGLIVLVIATTIAVLKNALTGH